MSHTLYLHVGTPKTGTTAIQGFLDCNDKVLYKMGYKCFVRSKAMQVISFLKRKTETLDLYDLNSIREAYMGDSSAFRKKVNNYIKKCLKKYNVIISDEGFWSNSKISLLELISDMNKITDNIKVIVYIRRQDLYIESIWNQYVKTSLTVKSVDNYINELDHEMDYYKRVCAIADIVGKENVIVRPFEKGQFGGKKKDLISDFMEQCNADMDFDKASYPKNINERLDGDYVWAKYLFNQEFNKYSKKCNLLIRNGFLKFNKKQGNIGYMSKDRRSEVIDKYKAGNELLAKEFLGRTDGSLFYDNNIDIEEYKNDFTEREKMLIELFAGIINEYEQKLAQK